jgi:probable F420-dependent oxidoreductase
VQFALNIPTNHVFPQGDFQNQGASHQLALAIEHAGFSGASLTEHPAPSALWLHNDATGHDAIDPFVGLAFVAAATTKLKLITTVIVLPYRNPFLTAKAAATLQVLSNGRLILGVGVGYQREEFAALGIPFEQRGARTDEALETIMLAWQGGPVVKTGRDFKAIGNEPRPVPSPRPPLWIGGGSSKAIERAARWGDGWMPFTSRPTDNKEVAASAINSIQEMKDKIAQLLELRDKLGRRGHFDISPTPFYYPQANTRSEARRVCEDLAELAAAGATWVNAGLAAPSRAAYLDSVAWFGQEVIPHFREKDGRAFSEHDNAGEMGARGQRQLTRDPHRKS